MDQKRKKVVATGLSKEEVSFRRGLEREKRKTSSKREGGKLLARLNVPRPQTEKEKTVGPAPAKQEPKRGQALQEDSTTNTR